MGTIDKAVFDLLVSKGILIQRESLCIYAITMEYIIGTIHKYFKENETVTVAQVRDLLNTSRKVVLPIMEYLNMNKYTIHDSDKRRLGPKMIEFSEK